MKVTTAFASLVIGFASVGLAQAAQAPASEASVPVASAGHDPYYPMAASTNAKTRAEVVEELQQARANGDLMSVSHDSYYPMRVAKR